MKGRIQEDHLFCCVSVIVVDMIGQLPSLQVALNTLHIASSNEYGIILTVVQAIQTESGRQDSAEAKR